VVILVPTYISQNINKTTGLGDMLSSTAFVADQF
jgi:ADP-dependent phosphofructokinase/glucokinase